MGTTTEQPEWVSVPWMARDLGVCQDKVRNWCRRKLIVGVINIGDQHREFFRVPRKAWEEFKALRQQQGFGRAEPSPRLRPRAGTNHLGI